MSRLERVFFWWVMFLLALASTGLLVIQFFLAYDLVMR